MSEQNDSGNDSGDDKGKETDNAKELLSKEEIDTLLTGVDDGDIDTAPVANDGEARLFDFAQQEKIVRGRMPTLEMLNERFARFFRSSLSEMLQRSCGVQPAGLDVLKYSDYASSLYVPASLNWVDFSPLRGKGLLTLDATLVFKLVDLFFGGSGQTAKIENREFTLTEKRIINRVIAASFLDIQQAWQSVVRFQPNLLAHESNPLLTNVISPSEIVIFSKFEIDIDGESGEFHIVVPLSMVEPIKDTLGAGIKTDVDLSDERWPELLQRELMHADVELCCKVAERTISLRDILDLQEGDVIPIDLPEQVRVLANNSPLFRGKLGVSSDRIAVQVKERLTDANK